MTGHTTTTGWVSGLFESGKRKATVKKTHSILARGHMVDSEIMWSNTTNINLFVYQTESHVLHK